jgi:hypothetical protein
MVDFFQQILLYCVQEQMRQKVTFSYFKMY